MGSPRLSKVSSRFSFESHVHRIVPNPRRVRSAAAYAAVTVLVLAGSAAAQSDAPPVTPTDLAGLQARAVEHNPSLTALRAAADAAAARVVESSTRPDPILMFGAMNVGLWDFDAGMPASMVPSLQITQTLPFFGKLELRESIADAEREATELAVAEAEWGVRAAVAGRFHALRALDRRTAVQRQTLDLLREFQTVARSLYAAGTGRQSDVLRADVEVARMDASIRRLGALREAEAASLVALLDLPHDAEVGEMELPTVPTTIPDVAALLERAIASRPLLEVRAVSVERARREVDLAERDVWPDVTVSAQLGRRGGDAPRTMGGLTVGASLPIQRGSRQEPRVAMAEARVRGALAEQSGARAAVAAELRARLADLDRAGSLLVLYRDEILPTARANVTSTLSSYRVGEVDFASLVDAQLAVDRYEQDYEQLIADYGTTVEFIEASIGGTLDGPRILPTELSLPEPGNDR